MDLGNGLESAAASLTDFVAVIRQQPVAERGWVFVLPHGDPGAGGDVVGVLDPRLGEDFLLVQVKVKGSLHVGDDGELGELL